ncbi:MAG: hypothetical protein HFJ18_00375 [Clostridia bacterium]|nr:hypothetical protein [Clostridia bacterium]
MILEMNNDQLTSLLQSLLMIMGVILAVLVVILMIILIKRSKKNRNTANKKDEAVKKERKNAQASQYNQQSVFDFMEFDKIEDNMIIQKEGFKYLMVIECQGINYDLMSGLEKASVEQGFIQFLNTLRHAIQIYTQTRKVNLNSSLNNYKEKVEETKRKLEQMNARYDEILHSREHINPTEIQRLQYEIVKQRNLYEYGVDIVNATEKMSLNSNILRKYYYIVVPYYAEDITIGKYDKEEIKGLAFSELYTNCQSMIQSLGSCSINAKILNSRELAELLYVAYNRDESESYELEKAIRSGYNELYTTSQDVLDKKMKELDIVINERATILANSAIRDVVLETKKEREIKEKESQMDTLVDEMAKNMISESEGRLGKELAKKSIEKIDEKQTQKEEKANEEKAKKGRRATGRK